MNILYDRYAHILAYDYGFCPVADAKYEPNYKATDVFYFTLAKRRRGINVLVKFNSKDLLREWAVTGNLTPDASCNYKTVGWYNDRRYGRRIDGFFFIWYDGAVKWYISSVLGTPGAAYWDRADLSMFGVYTPRGTAAGNATVAEGVHP
ncbi:hypothetical protein KAR91_83445 [Candidatus Pacearchaeota archaeon]|nr:hypothetical protein [Candidatus Pacearchaeota archaeon]